ncbi:glycosyltransferase [Leucobacter sp. W1038]|uniref:glycosyltransferase n=1 Tax=Leucobacter sp. W1038 TaxID=3438281 RepID=UPI003D952352
MRRRASLPGWVNRMMESVARNPDGFVGRLAGRLLRGKDPEPTSVPEQAVRLYIAPTNYSGQGYAWARAVERADSGIGARNMAVEIPGGFGFAADTHVPIASVNASAEWAEAEWAVVTSFTHVLVEAERSIFGRRFDRDLRKEIAALEQRGISVAFLCHGTDIRDPAAHATRTPWSPYPQDPRTDTLQADALANHRLLADLRRPTFVSTPDLIDDVPWARWCPVVVDATPFAAGEPFTRPIPRVLHVSSSAVQKGTHLIAPVVQALSSQGLIEYQPVTGAAAADMPALYAGADIVLDQFRLGSYGVAACEAMAAGRVVVGHVLPSVRERVRNDCGHELPIVEATPDTLAAVLTELITDRERSRAIAARGPGFVAAVHDGRLSANALLEGWIRGSG